MENCSYNLKAGECCWDARKTLMLLSFLGLMIFSAMEVCLAIAIVAIVKRNVTTDITEDEAKNVCPAPENAPEDSVVVSKHDIYNLPFPTDDADEICDIHYCIDNCHLNSLPPPMHELSRNNPNHYGITIIWYRIA